MKTIGKKIVVALLVIAMLVAFMPAVGNVNNDTFGTNKVYAGETLTTYFEVTITTNSVIEPGSNAVFNVKIQNITNKSYTVNVNNLYYREKLNSETYPGVDFGKLSGGGITEQDTVTIGAKKAVNITLTGTIPDTWNKKSEVMIVVYSDSIGWMGQGEYEADPSEQNFTWANTLRIKGKTVKIKYKKLKKTKQVLAVTKVIKFFDKGQGNKKYEKVKGNKKIKINKTSGKVTVNKKLKKGTYKVKVKVMALGSEYYEPSEWKTVTFKIKVK